MPPFIQRLDHIGGDGDGHINCPKCPKSGFSTRKLFNIRWTCSMTVINFVWVTVPPNVPPTSLETGDPATYPNDVLDIAPTLVLAWGSSQRCRLQKHTMVGILFGFKWQNPTDAILDHGWTQTHGFLGFIDSSISFRD